MLGSIALTLIPVEHLSNRAVYLPWWQDIERDQVYDAVGHLLIITPCPPKASIDLLICPCSPSKWRKCKLACVQCLRPSTSLLTTPLLICLWLYRVHTMKPTSEVLNSVYFIPRTKALPCGHCAGSSASRYGFKSPHLNPFRTRCQA